MELQQAVPDVGDVIADAGVVARIHQLVELLHGRGKLAALVAGLDAVHGVEHLAVQRVIVALFLSLIVLQGEVEDLLDPLHLIIGELIVIGEIDGDEILAQCDRELIILSGEHVDAVVIAVAVFNDDVDLVAVALG